MPIIADAGGPSISENPDELLTKYEADNKFILDGETADFGKGAEELKKTLYGDSVTCTPEEKEHNAEQFIERYAADLELLLSTEVALKIGEEFEENGDLEAAIFIVISHMDTPVGGKSIKLKNVEEATEQIIQYLNPRTTSIRIDEKLRSEEGIAVSPGMNASYIPALSGSNRSFNLAPNADILQVGDILSYGGDATSLMRNDTQIGELNTPDEGIPELVGSEFMESRYTPIIMNHQESSSDPLKNISGEQIELIGNEYAAGIDIVEAMKIVLGHNHEAVSVAENLDNPDKIYERRSQMYEDLGVESTCRIDPNTGEGGDTITNLVSENYTRIIGSDGEVDSKASVILATQISANKIIEGKHTFTRTQEFDRAYKRIQEGSTSPEELKKDLLLIYSTVNNAEGIRGKSKQGEAQRIRKRSEQKSLFLNAEFLEIQTLFIKAQEAGDIQGVQEQREAVMQLKDKDMIKGEATSLGGGELDLMAQLDDALGESA